MKLKTFLAILLVFITTWPAAATAGESVADQHQQITFEVPPSYVDRVRKEGAVLELSVNEAVRLALANNLEIAIENYNEELDRENIVRVQGFFDPSLFFTVGFSDSEVPTTSTLDAGGGVEVNTFNRFVFDTRLQQNVKGGGALSILLNNNRQNTNSTFSFINPRFNSSFSVSFTQPLWRGFRQTSTRRQLELFNLNTRISDTAFQQRVAEVLQQVQNQYWELVYAVENYETQRQSMELAIIQHRNNVKRVDIGVMAPIEITSSQAEVARREQGLIQSEVQIINAQNALKRLLAPDPEHSIWNLSLIPTDRPQMRDVMVTLEEAIATSFRNRPELERLQLQIEQNEVDRAFYQRERKPSVNLRVDIGSVGNAGNVTMRSLIDLDRDGVPDGFGPLVPNVDDPRFGALGNSWGQVFGFSYINYGIFADVTIPLRNRAAQADMAMVKIRERQYNSTVKNQQQMIIVEVRNAFETIQTRQKSLEAARVARQLAEEQLSGENKRFEAGLSTNFEVLRFQRDLAENLVSELRAEVDYQLALIALEKATYTIIDDNDVVLARGDN